MSSLKLYRPEKTPSLFDDFFKPWNEWFDDSRFLYRMLTVPPVNIVENENEFIVSMSIPGFKKEDFKIDLDGNMLTIKSEKEETEEEKELKFTRKEYMYSSFSRSFTMPEEIYKEKIEAKYENGILKLFLPRKEETKKIIAKQIAVK